MDARHGLQDGTWFFFLSLSRFSFLSPRSSFFLSFFLSFSLSLFLSFSLSFFLLGSFRSYYFPHEHSREHGVLVLVLRFLRRPASARGGNV